MSGTLTQQQKCNRVWVMSSGVCSVAKKMDHQTYSRTPCILCACILCVCMPCVSTLCVCVYVCPFRVYAFMGMSGSYIYVSYVCAFCCHCAYLSRTPYILCVCTLLPPSLPLQCFLAFNMIAVHHSCSKSKPNAQPSCIDKASKSCTAGHIPGLEPADLRLPQSRVTQLSCCNISHRLSPRHVLCAGAAPDCGCIELAAS